MTAAENTFTVGTRGSALARWQTDHVTAALAAAREKAGLGPVTVDVKVITTQGDVSQAARLVGQIEKGFFTAELEASLRAGEIDWAVHSLKDLPTRLPEDLAITAILPRAAAGDLMIIEPSFFEHQSFFKLPIKDGARIGTSSLRRDAMLRAMAPRCASLPLRGNVPTRLEKLRSGAYDAIVLASAGVERLGLSLEGLVAIRLDPRSWPPAPGQGAVAVETRANDPRTQSVLAPLDHADTREATEMERAFLRVLEGGCSTPFGCYISDGRAHLGREENGEWAARSIHLPDTITEAFMNAALEDLTTEPENTDDHHALWRPL